MALSKNQYVTDKPKSVMFDTHNEQATFGHKWTEASTCWEVMDGVFNILNAVYQIRPYSYEAHAICRGLHQVRYFFNVSTGPAEQKKLIEAGVNRVLAKNRSNAMEGEPPLVFREVLEVYKALVGEMVPGCPEHLLQTGDPYTGKRSEGHLFFASNNGPSGHHKKTQPQPRIDRTPYDEAHRARKAKEDEMEKKSRQNRERFLERLCSAFNSTGCSDKNCQKIHKCSRVVKKSHQGKMRDRVCMEQHPASGHK